MILLSDIVDEIESRAHKYDIASIQNIRKDIKKLKRASKSIFNGINDDNWAFHSGGRNELQFNVGFEEFKGETIFRHGVAFSLETSRFFTDINPLIPKIARFNDFLQEYYSEFLDLKMWHFAGRPCLRSDNYTPRQITKDIAKVDTFICVGRTCQLSEINIDLILTDFDRMIPLYTYVESTVERSNLQPSFGTSSQFLFRPGCPHRVEQLVAIRTQQAIEVDIRHARIQQKLYDSLVSIHGSENVGTEIACIDGGRIDLIVKDGTFIDIYEIKTANTARGCIRQALGQILDYAYWTTRPSTRALYIVGTPQLSQDSADYLKYLNGSLPIPVFYRQIEI